MSRSRTGGEAPTPLRIDTQQISKFYQDTSSIQSHQSYKPHPVKMMGSKGDPEILIWSDYPFAVFVRGFPREQELYLQWKLEYFEREEEMIANMVCAQEVADNFDIVKSLTVIEKSYRFAQKVFMFLKHTISSNVQIPVSYRLPDLFPRDSPLACRKFMLDESGRNLQLEQAIQSETLRAMTDRLAAAQM